MIPYTLDVNDMKFLSPNGFVTAGQFLEYLVDTFEQLYAEGGRMMNVGLHCRIVGKPGRVSALDRFLAHVKQKPDVWVTTRAEIARHWRSCHPAVAVIGYSPGEQRAKMGLSTLLPAALRQRAMTPSRSEPCPLENSHR